MIKQGRNGRNMFFSKKNADNNYFALKDKVLKNFEMYQHFPTYEDPHVIRDKWSEELEDAKSVYKLSKKYVDTEADVVVLKNVIDRSKERVQFYKHAADALDYRLAVADVRGKFEEYDEAISNSENLNDGEGWYDKWRDLYEKTLSLYKDRNKYAGDEYDSAKLPDIYYD